MRLVESAHWTLALALFLSPLAAHPQSPNSTPTPPAETTQLPDSPGSVKAAAQAESPAVPESVVSVAKSSFASSGTKPPPCQKSHWIPRVIPVRSNPADSQSNTPTPTLSCVNILDPYV